MLCAFVAVMALAALAGWALDLDWLKTVLPGSTTMKANAGVGLFALALGQWPLRRSGVARRHRRRIRMAWAGAAAALAAATLVEYGFGVRLGIDELLFADPATTSAPYNGRMSPATALAIVSLGTGSMLVCGPGRRWVAAAHWLALPASVVGLLSLTGYAYGVERTYNFGPYVAVAVNTAVGICAISASLLLTRWREGWGRALVSHPLARTVLARLLPLLVALPFATGLLVVAGVRAGWYQPLFGIAIFAILSSIGLFWVATMIAGRVEGALASSEASFQLLAENASDMISRVGPNGERRYVSPASAVIFGVSPQALMKHGVLPMIHPDDRVRVRALQEGLLGGLITESSITFRILHPIRGEVWAETHARVLLDPGMRRPSGYISVLRDVTERVRLEADREERGCALRLANVSLEHMAQHLTKARDRAERASQAKSRFLAGMSHELRTPLNGVLGYAQLLRLEGGLNATQLGRVDSMLGAGSHLLQMINCVLDLSEIEAEHVTLRMAAVDLHGAAKVCLDLVRSAAEAKQLTLRCVVAPGLPTHVTTDATRLRQVLLNLLGNAVKFTARGGVTLRLGVAQGEHQGGAQGGDQDAATLRLEVADTGPGISAEQRHRLFQDFDRLDVEETSTVEGTGLGLAISARLAVLLGGRLGHEDNPGGGSVFWLELPAGTASILEAPQLKAPRLDAPSLDTPCLEAPRLEAATTPGAVTLLPAAVPEPPVLGSAVRGQTRTVRVLVADDVAMNRDIARAFLVSAGHVVVLAENGVEAVAKATAETFDVILMDVRMPLMDGLDAAARIRGLKGARGRVPIVALTAQSFAGQMAECRKAGMDAHLTKPFTPDTLLEAVAHWAAAGRRPGTALPTQEAVPTDAADAPASSTATWPDEPDAGPTLEVLGTAAF